MITLDKNFLADIGLADLNDDDAGKLLEFIREKLEERTGEKIIEALSEDQVKEFESLIDNDDQDGAQDFLEKYVPNYAQIVKQELDDLKLEVKEHASDILAS